MKKYLYILVILIPFLIVSELSSARSDLVVVIVNPQIQIDSLDIESVRRIYLGKKSRWDNDQKIEPTMLKTGITHEAFIIDIMDRTVSKFIIY